MNIRILSPLLALLLVVSAPACGGGDGNPDPDGGSEDLGSEDAGEDMGGGDAGDVTPPVRPNSGVFSVSNPTSSSVDLSWMPSTDETTAQSALEYRVYFGLEDNLGTVALVLANGTPANEWQADLRALTVANLALDQMHYFTILVRDEAGNVTVYDVAGEATLDGAWQAVETPEDYDQRIDYPRFSLSPSGDVALSWHTSPNYESEVAIRARDADTFGEDGPWGGTGVWNANTGYGFDGSLVSTTVREETLLDLLFGTYSVGTGADLEEVATDIEAYHSEDSFPCVARNGDVMVAWLEGPTAQDQSLWARFRTGGTWGTPSLVNASEGQALEGLHVVCSPDGDHMVLFSDHSASPFALKARVYDASASAWEAPAFTLTTGPGPYMDVASAARTADGRAVVAWEEAVDDSEGATHVLRARTYGAGTWSTVALLDDSFGSLVQVAAAGNDVHVVWPDGSQFVTSRLDAGSTAWTTSTPIGPVNAAIQLCLAGDSFGGVVLAWRETTTVLARLYRDGWGSATTLRAESDTGTGDLSLDCVLDHRKRASVAWTVRPDIGSSIFSINVRTYR